MLLLGLCELKFAISWVEFVTSNVVSWGRQVFLLCLRKIIVVASKPKKTNGVKPAKTRDLVCLFCPKNKWFRFSI